MRRLSMACTAVGALLLSASAASAQNITSWVASNGNDGNTCARLNPCATFAGALLKTVDSGVILCADSGTYVVPATGLTITKGVEIDCRSQYAIAEITGTTGIVINLSDPTQSVTIRGLVVNGRLGGGGKANTAGVRIVAARNVSLSSVLVEQFQLQGVLDVRSLTANSTLQLTNSSFAGNGGPGIVAATTNNGFLSSTTLNEVYSGYNAFGIALAAGNRARITNSIFPYNTTAIASDPGGSVTLAKSVINYSTTAISMGGTIVLGDNDIAYNTTVFAGGGFIYTNGNNRLHNYSSLGVTPTALTPSTDRGQQ